MLPFASEDEARVLKQLMGDNTVAAREAEPVSKPAPKAEEKLSSGPKHPLDSIMRDVVQDALAIARMCAKTISLSYDVGETALAQNDLKTLQARLGQSLRALILESLPQEGVGHIDLTIKGRELCLTAQGTPPQFTPKSCRLDRSVAGQINLYLPLITTAEDMVEIETDDAPAPRRMITDETEDELRAQLSQLMEPSAAPSDIASVDNAVMDNATLAETTLAEVGT